MYVAKRNGKSRCERFVPEMHEQAIRRLEVASELRGAIDNGHLVVYYQPIVAVATGRMLGAEALVRWNHPTGGLLAPAEFIASAEESGIIIPLGAYVLETACSQLALWRTTVLADARSFNLAVNISAVQLSTPDLVDQLERLLAQTGIPPEWLDLEITETAAIADLDHIARKVEQIQSLGVRIAIDDFGIGHNSLKHLHRLPVDVVKIDQSFVAALGPGDNRRGMVAAVLALARTLGMRTVAEGVETPEQAARLRELGADLAQGYLYGRAQPASALTPRLAAAEALRAHDQRTPTRRPS
jgi:EAL domain-containing protein (putative c-di-GMP-specific phosphodiesterase class I)